MAQIYIVICDTQKNVLVAKKNSVCSFWQGKQTSKTTIVNGGGQYAYPGGRLKHGVTPENGAYSFVSLSPFFASSQLDLASRYVAYLVS